MKALRLLPALAALCLLASCASGPKPTPAPLPTVRISPPASLTQAPQPLPPLPPSPDLKALVENHVQTARMYHLLASQMCSLMTYLQAPTEGCEPWMKSTSNKPQP